MPALTVVSPYAPEHADVVQRAVESVVNQTVPCNVVTIEDKDGRGAGYARNQGLRQVHSEYVAFLDADDTLEPNFAELCFMILEQVEGRKYVYTNWYEGEVVKQAPSPCELWTQQTYHLVTTVMRAEDVRRIGGYDEMMPGAEDTDFGIRLKLSGVCGVHLNVPLLHYRTGGRRSKDLRVSGQETAMQAYMKQRYGEYTMGCCGPDTPNINTPQGEKLDGDVLAQAQWAGNRRTRGLATGRVYAYVSMPDVCYVDPRDVAASPQLWKKVSAIPQTVNPALQPGYNQQTGDWRGAANLVFGGAQQAQVPAQMEWEYKPVTNDTSKEDVLGMVRKKK